MEIFVLVFLWAGFATLVFWVFSKLRILRQISGRVYDLEYAVFGPGYDEESDCNLGDEPEGEVEVEGSGDPVEEPAEQSDELAGAADVPVDAAGKPED